LKTSTNSGSLEAIGIHLIKEIIGKVVNSLIMNIVGNGQEVYVRRVGRGKSTVNYILALLDERRIVMEIILSIKIKIDNVVSQLCHNGVAITVALRKRRTHIGRNLPNDVAKRHLVLDHLGLNTRDGERRQILVRPSVRGDLMTIGDHTLNICSVSGV
jgi:hypothetical protein